MFILTRNQQRFSLAFLAEDFISMDRWMTLVSNVLEISKLK